jgi:hypothetical protein
MRLARWVVLVLVAMGLAGCLGPQAVCCTRTRYNEVIHTTNNEELLLNLVRLRYLEDPGFLPVTGLNAQFELTSGLLGRFGEDRGGATNFGEAQLNFADRPTITFAPQRAPELTKGLLSRIPLDTLYLLAANGEDTERDLRLFVRNINGIENCTSCGGPAPASAPEFAEFRHVASLLGALRRDRNMVLAVEHREVDVPGPVPLDAGGMPRAWPRSRPPATGSARWARRRVTPSHRPGRSIFFASIPMCWHLPRCSS